MKNVIPEEMQKRIVERPEHLTNRKSSEKYEKLKVALELMNATHAIIYTKEEIKTMFGSCYKQSIKTSLAKRGMKKVRMSEEKGMVYIWQTKV